MACWGLVPRFWVKDKGFKEDDAVWGEAAQKSKPADPPPDATELREGAFVATILCDDREEEMEENMEQVINKTLPKAQRTRGLSSSTIIRSQCTAQFTKLEYVTISKSRLSINFKI